jgi:hypothetical protein
MKRAAPYNQTVAALMARGIDSDLARRLQKGGHTLASLKTSEDSELIELGLSDQNIGILRSGVRPPIPVRNVAEVLWANRFICCVCRAADKSVILHHISPWAKSHSHDSKNLALVCLEHHAQAHRTGNLEQNLTPVLLKKFKEMWETEVRTLDPAAIMQASRIPTFHWLWFNHVRIFDAAKTIGIELNRNPYFWAAQRHADLDDDGSFGYETHQRPYLYSGGDGILLYEYVRDLLDEIISKTAIFDISNDLDRSLLSKIISPGDMILIRGRHHFRMIERHIEGPGQASEVRRKANGVEIIFVIDRWEAVSTSSWGGWLRGTQSVSSLVRVGTVAVIDGVLQIRGTGIAIGGIMEGLPRRSYFKTSCPQNRYQDEDMQFDESFPDNVD